MSIVGKGLDGVGTDNVPLIMSPLNFPPDNIAVG